MTKDRLNGLASLHTDKDIKMYPKEVVGKFATKHKRRLKMVHILKSDKTYNPDDDIIQSEVY